MVYRSQMSLGTQQRLIELGLGADVELIRNGRCPFCGFVIHGPSMFRDKLSLKEFHISGLCQSCQDETFKEIDDAERE